MDDELERIHRLFGALSEAKWRRACKPGVSAVDVLTEDVFVPNGPDELAIWLELTSPENYDSLRRYVEYWQRREINDYAERLHQQLLFEATNRWEQWNALTGI